MSAPNKDLGPCSVLWDPSGANIELNPTFGGVHFRDEVLSVPIKQDQQGETDVDRVLTGRVVELEVPMTQSSLAQLEKAIAGSTKAAGRLHVENVVGGAVFADAKEIRVKPIVNGVVSVDTSEWLYLYRAYPFSNLDWPYDVSEQRTTNVIFRAFPDDTSGNLNAMWRLGPDS